jgi:hypothetical protein
MPILAPGGFRVFHDGVVDDGVSARYRRLLAREQWFEVGACWTVVGSSIGPLVTGVDVVRALGGDAADVVDGNAADPPHGLDRYMLAMVQVGPAVSLWELNYQGSRPVVLSRLSTLGPVHSACWNINGISYLSYADRGDVVTVVHSDYPNERSGTDPAALDADLDEVLQIWNRYEAGDFDVGEHAWKAALMAVIERRTGVALDSDMLAAPQPTIVLAPLRDPPSRPPDTIESRLHHGILAADPGRRRTVIAELIDTLADVFDLREEPAVRDGVPALRAGHLPDPTAQRHGVAFCERTSWNGDTSASMNDDPGWRLSQAGWVLNIGLSGPPLEAENAARALWHGRGALGERWPDVAQRLEHLLQTGTL